jgi:hypothetical protein
MGVTGTQRARLEAAIGRAHRAVYNALRRAEEFGDLGIEVDLDEMLRRLTNIQSELLGGARGRKPLPGQLELPRD